MVISRQIKNLDLAHIAKVIEELELSSTSELLPIIARKSINDHGQNASFSFIFSLTTTMMIYEYCVPFSYFEWYFLSLGILFFASLTLSNFFNLHPFFISKKIKNALCLEKAQQLFFAHNLHETKDRTGILIYISLLEKNVVILGDRGINSVLEKSIWDEIVNNFVKKLHQENITLALCEALKACGKILNEHFPQKTVNPNEISNHPIILL